MAGIIRPGVITNMDAAEEQVIFWRDHLDIAIEDLFPPIKLTRDQHVIARAASHGDDIKIVESRGSGKTWLTALIAFVCGVLYPASPVAVCSATAGQATLVLNKLKQLADMNPNIANEIAAGNARSLVQMSKDKGKCTLKNGSTIESFAINSMRGQRAKIIIIDEARDVDPEEVNAIVDPIALYRRDLSFNYNFPDYESKRIALTSACEKSNPFYDDFMKTVRVIATGGRTSFCCALDWQAAVANQVNPKSYFEKKKATMPESVFEMEYGSKFLGAASNSAFPYELTQTVRTLQKVELQQPKGSKSRYVASLDIATSEAKDADNSVISVIKFIEKADGSYTKKLVYMRSFHGAALDKLRDEIRILCHIKFPNIEKVVYDARGLGDSLDRFFDSEWIDMTTGKEYPPLVVDDKPATNSAAIRLLHPFRAVQALNQRIYTNLRVAIEKHTIELPIPQRIVQAREAELEDPTKAMSDEERAIYYEADGLQFEMGNIVGRIGTSGNILYDVSRTNLHKDRYSSLAMGNDYVCELEKESIKKHKRGKPCIGLASRF